MALDWVWVESPGTGLSEEPQLLSTKFGDGYEAVAPDGLHPITQQWDYQAVDVDDAIGNDMIAFLRLHSGATPFNYVPLWSTAPILVTARSWKRSLGSKVGLSNISATFEQWWAP